jgi:hypothetical protein
VKHVVQFSGGLSSWEAAMRVARRHGASDLWLVFSDVLVEDADLYRFLIEAAAHVYGCVGVADLVARAAALPPVREDTIEHRKSLLRDLAADTMARLPRMVWLIEGRTPWEVFRDRKFLGNSRVDPCSEVLKRKQLDAWCNSNCTPDETVRYIGFGWNEPTRIEAVREIVGDKWRVEFPMDDPPYLGRAALMQAAIDRGIQPPRLYYFGFKHNNCGGLCCKMGQAQAAKLLDVDPCLYGFGERQEESLRELLGDVSMLTDRRGDGKKKPLPLKQLRERLEADPRAYDVADVGACSCFAPPEPDATGEAA